MINFNKFTASALLLLTVSLPNQNGINFRVATPSPTPTATAVSVRINKPSLNINTEIGKRAWIEEGKVTVISGSTLTVTKGGISYTVNTDSSTIFRRRFGGKSQLSEIVVNDSVNVLGKWQDEAKTQILATHIRDLSIQKRHATFFGTVKTKTETTLILTTANKGDQTVTIGNTTKLVNRKMEEIKMADIQIGDRVRVKGIWDLTIKAVSEVTQIKDFSIPVQPTPKTD